MNQSRNAGKQSKAQKALRKLGYKKCCECGKMYEGMYARVFFLGLEGTKRFNITHVEICDPCLNKYLENPNIRASRTKK